jgi:hypothetical protein
LDHAGARRCPTGGLVGHNGSDAAGGPPDADGGARSRSVRPAFLPRWSLLKIANARIVAERSPATKRMLTWNAVENDPMIRVKEAMGFELVHRGVHLPRPHGRMPPHEISGAY